MSKDYNHEIGYETLQKDWEVYKKQAPRGVTLVKGSGSIYLQFKTPNTSRSKYKCDCTFSIDGMIDAVRKAHKVAEKLKSITGEVEFWNWYDKEIKQESQLIEKSRILVAKSPWLRKLPRLSSFRIKILNHISI